MYRSSFLLFTSLMLLPGSVSPLLAAEDLSEAAGASSSEKPRIAFIGLHGGVFDVLKRYEDDYPLRLEYLEDEQLAEESTDFSRYAMVLIQHARGEDRDQYRQLIKEGKVNNPKLRIISISGLAEKHLPELASAGEIELDEQITAYYGNTSENLRRMLLYISVKYLKQAGNILPQRKPIVVPVCTIPIMRGTSLRASPSWIGLVSRN
ncbi:MAG: hypothetical protein R3C11_06660 [Planctomycetaceae bacterium]